MVGKNNKFLKENKNNQRFLRFSLRKLSVGVVSVAIAAGFYVGGSQSVLADTTSTDPTVNQQSASTSTGSPAVASTADSTAAEAGKSTASAAEAGKSAASAAEQQEMAMFNVAKAKSAATSNTANLLGNKAQSNAVSDTAKAEEDQLADKLLKNIKISDPTDSNFARYQGYVDKYNNQTTDTSSQYVFSVISDSRIDTDFIWTVDQDTGEKVSVYFNNWDSGITGYHQFIDADFDDNHNDYRYSKRGVTLSYDKPEGSSDSISVVDDNYNIWDPDDANLQDVYEINGNTDNSRSNGFAIMLPEKGQPIIKFLYRNPDTGKLMDLRAPIYYSNGLTGQKFELDIGDSYKQELKDMFAGFKLVGSSKASGTFTQFAQGKTYVEHIASDDSEVIYQQIDAEGTMKVFYREKDGEKQPLLDTYGNPYQLEAGSSVDIDTGNGIKTAYNPFVTGDHAYELIYEPEDQSANIVYVDKDGNKIKTDTVNGKTTQTVHVKSNVPAGWVLVKGQHDAPATITFTGAHTDDITIKIEHGKTSVDHNHPVKPGDKTPSGKEIKGAHDEDLNQTITRTINITEPDQATKTTTQVAHIYRDATVDDVTGEVTYSAWSTDSADWTAVNIPSHAGYTAHQSDGQTGIPVVTVKDGQKDVNIDVTYTPDEQKGQITYVDKKGNQISSTPLTGKTDQDVDVKGKINVPANWELVPGQTIPDTVKATADGIPTVTVKVQPKLDSITDPAKLNKSISRTITINKPGEKPQVINQHADFTRTGQYNEVTGTTIYTDWALKDSTLEAVDAPAVPGYTPNVAHVDSVENPTADTKPANVVINYSADDQTQKIDYVDPNGKVVKTDTVKGKTDETVKVTPNVPDHYELVPGQEIPGEVKITDDNPAITVKVTPKLDPVTDPAKLNKSISRTITINKPGEKPQVINQTATFKRTGKTNEVTGITTYTPWVLDQNGLTTVSAPEVPGYTPSQKTVASVDNPTANTKLTDVTINYTANSQTTHINYVDKDGETVKSDTVSGKTDETVKTNSEVPAGWKITDGQIPETIHFTGEETPDTTITIEHDTTNVDHIKPVKSGDKTPSGKVIDGAHESDLNQTITRTINVTTPDGQTTTTKQVAKIFRDATVDDVTGEVTYGNWSSDAANWTDFTPAPIAGYTPSQSDVAAVTVQNGQKDVTVDITYTANNQTTHVVYVDGDGHTVKTDTVTGKTDQTVDTNSTVPTGWELTKDQVVPETITFTGDSTPDTKVTVQHHHSNVSHTDPVPGDGKTPTNKPINGAHDSDLNQTITRTINVKDPHTNKVATTKQVAKIFRDATVDDVTGEVTYGNWSSDAANWTDFTPAPIAGYTPSQSDVAAVTVQNGQKDVTVDITYTANNQTTHVVYVDGDGHTVKTDTVTGKTDQTVDTNSTVPTGWELTKDQVVPETITFTGDSTPDTKVTVQHHHSNVSHTDPVPGDGKTPTNKPINGAHDSDLNQTITRTINVKDPHTNKVATTKQVAKIFRDATVDDVTGEVTYSDWSEGTWADFTPGQVAGYTASPADVPAVTVDGETTDQTVNISYTANEGTVLIKYVDRDGNEIGQQVITGHVGDTIKVTPQFPENWVPVDPDTVPAEVQIKEENGQIIIVVVRHAEKDPVQTEKVTRTIMVTTPDGQTKTIKQVVTISRYGDLDLVTGQIAWQPWTTAQWDVFKPAAITGYTPSLAEVPAVTVDGETTDQTVDITYAAVATPAQPEHQAPTASDTTDAQQATNQKADSNAQPAVTVVTSQQTATAQQAESTTNSRRLPQTGNSHDASALAGLGLASLMGLFGLGGKRRKRD